MVRTNGAMRILGFIGLVAFGLLWWVLLDQTGEGLLYDESHWIYWPQFGMTVLWFLLFVIYMASVVFGQSHAPMIGLIDAFLFGGLYFLSENGLPPTLADSPPRLVFQSVFFRQLAYQGFWVAVIAEFVLVLWGFVTLFPWLRGENKP